MGQRSDRDKIIAYLRGIAEMSRTDPRTQGMIGSALRASLDAAASGIQEGKHEDADELWPQFLPRETVRQQPAPPRPPAERVDEDKLAAYVETAEKAARTGARGDASEAEILWNLMTPAERAEAQRRRGAN
jgi:hypothetical protein